MEGEVSVLRRSIRLPCQHRSRCMRGLSTVRLTTSPPFEM